MTKQEFLGEAGTICEQAKHEKERAVSEALAGGQPSEQGLEKLVEQAIVPAYRKALTQLEQLEAPAGDQKAVEAILVSYESALEDTEQKPGELVEGDPFTKAEKAAQQYGLDACVF